MKKEDKKKQEKADVKLKESDLTEIFDAGKDLSTKSNGEVGAAALETLKLSNIITNKEMDSLDKDKQLYRDIIEREHKSNQPDYERIKYFEDKLEMKSDKQSDIRKDTNNHHLKVLFLFATATSPLFIYACKKLKK